MGNLLGAPVTTKETHVGALADQDIEYGLSTMQGWRIHMEDAHIAEGDIYATTTSGDAAETISLPGHSVFAVFDGHGGTYAAMYSGNNFLRVLSCQTKFVEYAKFNQERSEKEKTMDDAAKAEYIRGGLESLEQAFQDAFVELDKEVGMSMQGRPHPDADASYHKLTPAQIAAEKEAMEDAQDGNPLNTSKSGAADGDSGTTACVVMITPDWILCSNAGDSRSVLSRNSHHANPLSYDHKPDDEAEERRIRAAGGYVTGGRVEGDLAVSRGLGDFRFKVMSTVLAGIEGKAPADTTTDQDSNDTPPMGPGDQKVSSVPDINVLNRTPEVDEFIIVACDGIWDVQTNQQCIDAVSNMMSEGESNMGLVAEEVLDVCLELGSKDNMTAIIIKLNAQQIGEGGGVVARRQLREKKSDDSQVESATAATTDSDEKTN